MGKRDEIGSKPTTDSNAKVYTTSSGWSHTWGESQYCPAWGASGHQHTIWNPRRMVWECACGSIKR
jgi:hypothetical protein